MKCLFFHLNNYCLIEVIEISKITLYNNVSFVNIS